MQRTLKRSTRYALGCALLLALLAGCGTLSRNPPLPDVGTVVVAPKLRLPPLPQVVQQTLPKPAGYFQKSLLDYFSGSPPKPTP